MKSYYVYILKCNDNSYYTGCTDDLARRLNEHSIPYRKENGVLSYVGKRLPYALMFAEEFSELYEALVAERMIKGWSRKKKEALIRHDWDEISNLAKKKFKK